MAFVNPKFKVGEKIEWRGASGEWYGGRVTRRWYGGRNGDTPYYTVQPDTGTVISRANEDELRKPDTRFLCGDPVLVEWPSGRVEKGVYVGPAEEPGGWSEVYSSPDSGDSGYTTHDVPDSKVTADPDGYTFPEISFPALNGKIEVGFPRVFNESHQDEFHFRYTGPTGETFSQYPLLMLSEDGKTVAVSVTYRMPEDITAVRFSACTNKSCGSPECGVETLLQLVTLAAKWTARVATIYQLSAAHDGLPPFAALYAVHLSERASAERIAREETEAPKKTGSPGLKALIGLLKAEAGKKNPLL